MSVTTIAIIGENRITQVGIEQVIARNQQLQVVASVRTADDLFALGIQPDVAVVDLAACHAADPYAVVSALAEHSATLAVCGSADNRVMLSVLLSGAIGLVTLDTDPDEFLAAVQACARRSLYLVAGVAGHLGAELRQRCRASESQGLARREIETLRLLAHGYTHGQIARRLGLTEATVNTYVKRIRTKLNAGNKAELTRIAVDMGYAEPGRGRLALRPVADDAAGGVAVKSA